MGHLNIGSGWLIGSALLKRLPPDAREVKQVHGAQIIYAGSSDFQKTEGDGIWLKKTDRVKAVIKTADCLPLALVTPETGALLHISRKSLAAGILAQVEKVIPVGQISGVYAGPNICEKHFTFESIGSELSILLKRYPEGARVTGGITYVDIWRIVEGELEKWGVPSARVVRDGRCTYETKQLPSYRRSGRSINAENHLATVLSSSA